MAKKNRYKLKWSEQSVQTLEYIYSWNCENISSERADKILKSLRTQANRISKSPFLYAKCHEISFPNTDIRKTLVGNTYWIVYHIEDTRIVILDIIHGSQNPDTFSKIRLN